MALRPDILLQSRVADVQPAIQNFNNALMQIQNRDQLAQQQEARGLQNQLLQANIDQAASQAQRQASSDELLKLSQLNRSVGSMLESGNLLGAYKTVEKLAPALNLDAQDMQEFSDALGTSEGRNALLNAMRQADGLVTAQTTRSADSSKTAAQKEFEMLQRLRQEDPDAAEEFGKKTGFISREGGELSSESEKRLFAAQDAAVESESNASRYNSLANEIEAVSDTFGGGAAAGWREKIKEVTGSQDAVSAMRRRYNAVRSSQAVSNLPPGAASDKDIELALKGFPRPDAPASEITSFLRGIAKMEEAKSNFEQFKADWISNNGTPRGMLKEWNKSKADYDITPTASGEVEAPQSATQNGSFTTKSGITFTVK